MIERHYGRLHVSRQTLQERKGFTPGMALRVGKLTGNGPVLWLSMQQDVDLWHAARELADAVCIYCRTGRILTNQKRPQPLI